MQLSQVASILDHRYITKKKINQPNRKNGGGKKQKR